MVNYQFFWRGWSRVACVNWVSPRLAKWYNRAAMSRIITLTVLFTVAIPLGQADENSDRYRKQCAEIIAAKGQADENGRLWRLFEANWEYRMIASPEAATWRGYPGQNHRWSDLSMEAVAVAKTVVRQTLEAVRSFDRAKLNEANRLNYDLFRRNTEMAVERQLFPAEFLAVNQMDGLPRDVPSMIAMMPAAKANDYEDILARLGGIPALVDQTIVLLQEGLSRGIVPPRVPLRSLPDQVAGQVHIGPMTTPMLAKFKKFPATIPVAEQARLTEAAKAVYADAVRPALKRLHRFLRDEYVPNCRETVGRSALPNGRAWYDYQIKHYTTTTLSPDEIHNIGLREVKRIRAEMEAIRERVGFEGDLHAFFDFLRTDSQFYYDTADELLAGYRDICKRADPELTKLFRKLPRQPYGVIPVPSYIEKSVTTAYYQPGSNDAGRAGFMVRMGDPAGPAASTTRNRRGASPRGGDGRDRTGAVRFGQHGLWDDRRVAPPTPPPASVGSGPDALLPARDARRVEGAGRIDLASVFLGQDRPWPRHPPLANGQITGGRRKRRDGRRRAPHRAGRRAGTPAHQRQRRRTVGSCDAT